MWYKQKTAYEVCLSRVGSEMCIKDKSKSRKMPTAEKMKKKIKKGKSENRKCRFAWLPNLPLLRKRGNAHVEVSTIIGIRVGQGFTIGEGSKVDHGAFSYTHLTLPHKEQVIFHHNDLSYT